MKNQSFTDYTTKKDQVGLNATGGNGDKGDGGKTLDLERAKKTIDKEIRDLKATHVRIYRELSEVGVIKKNMANKNGAGRQPVGVTRS